MHVPVISSFDFGTPSIRRPILVLYIKLILVTVYLPH
jgi:hypothetical protein